jgi:hypothetical protein
MNKEITIFLPEAVAVKNHGSKPSKSKKKGEIVKNLLFHGRSHIETFAR